MGGFFYSESADAAASAKDFFLSIDLPVRELRFGPGHLVLLKKRYVPEDDNFHASGHGRIAGVGTWMTSTTFGPKSLPGLLESAVGDRREFRELVGNAAFVVYTGDRVEIITDRTGIYPVYVGEDDRGRHYSSSILALAESLNSLRISPQAVREFVNVETVLGGETVFENVNALPGGSVVDVRSGAYERYYDAQDCRCSPSEVPDLLVEHVRRLKNAEMGYGDISCDLSGGFDSRTVAALLHSAGVPHTLNTNTNPNDRDDHEAALRAAIAAQRPIVVYSFEGGQDRRSTEAYVFPRLDLSRDVPRSKRALMMFEGKASRHKLLLGGYGGELLRDVYSRSHDISEVVEAKYCGGLTLEPDDQRAYVARLRAKFRETLAHYGFDEHDRVAERIYFFEKMRSWGGTRIGVYNRYAYGWHPLLDHGVQRYLFSISISEKAEAALQRQVIAIDPDLAAEPYTASQIKSRLAMTAAKRIPRVMNGYQEAKRMLRSARLVGGRPHRASPVEGQRSEALSDFEAMTGLRLEQCRKGNYAGRYLTLVEAFRRYGHKILTSDVDL